MSTYLRPWQPTDASDLLRALTTSSDLSVQMPVPAPLDERAAEQFIVRTFSNGSTWRNWAIITDGAAVGNVSVSEINHRHDTGWVHFWLSAHVRGQGLARRAVASAVGWAFDVEELFRLELGHRVNNPASCRVAHAAGFVPEGIQRQKLRYGDHRFDVEIHARLATDPIPNLEPLPIRDN